MNLRFFTLLLFVAASTFAAEPPKLPSIPAEPIARKKELLFSDDFERAELGKPWAIVVPTFSLEKGTLKGTQMRFDAPEAEGKPAVEGTLGRDRRRPPDQGQRDRVSLPARRRAVRHGGV